jgi:ABC-type antimicrobial peptide transport system permease subunit
MFRTESGELFKIVIAGGLSTSVFQGYICIDLKRFTEFYPSVSGSSVYMIRCEDSIATKLGDAIRMRLEPFGVSVQTASEKLEEFFEVTNTYLAVFTVLGGFGIMLGVIGLGFVLRFNYTLRRKEFALMLASGLRESNLKRIILREQLFILSAGIITGVVSGVVSTLSSISSGGMVQWGSLVVIVISIGAAGFISMMISMQALKGSSIIENLRRE